MPVRLQGLFILHQPWYLSFLWALVRPFMKKKLRQRVTPLLPCCLTLHQIHFLNDRYDELFAIVPPEILPVDFHGTCQDDPLWWISQCEREELGVVDVQ